MHLRYIFISLLTILFLYSCTEDIVPPEQDAEISSITGGQFIMAPVLIEGSSLGSDNLFIYVDNELLPENYKVEERTDRIQFHWPRNIWSELADSLTSVELQVRVENSEGDSLLVSDIMVNRYLTADTVNVPMGSFTMGAAMGNADERPEHDVTITKNMLAMATEMPRNIYHYIMEDDYDYGSGFEDPAVAVRLDNFSEIFMAANRMSQIYGLDTAYVWVDSLEGGAEYQWNDNSNGWRLPTEAEWEYMASYNMSDFPSDAEIDNMAWTINNSGGQVKQVKLLQPNALGMYDMLGNVWELCYDTLRTYSQDAQTDPYGQPQEYENMPIRGGSVLSGYWVARPTNRLFTPPQAGQEAITGFRFVRNLE